MQLSRRLWLVVVFAFLGLANVIYYFVSNWGLVTVHAEGQPLSQVIRDIERQGHVTLTTNLDPETKVNMYVTKVPVTEALETLAAVTEARWSVLYVLAPDNAKLADGLTQVRSTEPAAEWKRIVLNLPPFLSISNIVGDTAPLDPRTMKWRVEPPATETLQDYLAQGVKTADVTYFLPAEWNPAVAKTPKSDTVRGVTKTLASATKSKFKEMFVLQGRRQGPPGDGQPRQMGQGGGRFEGMWQQADLIQRIDERVAQQIETLPADQRADAKKQYDSDKAFFQSLAGLPPEERRAKMQQFFQENSERMESRMDRSSPQQRQQRYSRYVQNRQAQRGK